MQEVNALEESIAAQLASHGLSVERSPDPGADLLATVNTATGPVTVEVEVEALPTVPPPSTDPSRVTMLAQPWVSARRARVLKLRDVPYVDSVGNMWLALPGFYVEVEGRPRPQGLGQRPVGTDRLSRPSSLRVVFALLTDPALIQLPLRELANACGTSLGVAQATVADLESEGFLFGSVPHRRLRHSGTLAERWVSHFRSRLLPKLDHLALRGPAPQWWFDRIADIPRGDASLGGEAGCELLGYPLRSVETLIYGPPPWAAARRTGRLGDAAGDSTVVLRERFWPVARDEGPRSTPSLLVYADLVGTDEPRLLQLAEQMRKSDGELRRLWSS